MNVLKKLVSYISDLDWLSILSFQKVSDGRESRNIFPTCLQLTWTRHAM